MSKQMLCPYCGNESKVLHTRLPDKPFFVPRERECLTCACVFKTDEGYNVEWLLDELQKKAST